jgi:hypothetical protein
MKPTEMKDGAPVYDVANMSPEEIALELLEADGFKLPCWIKVGRDRHRVTAESASWVAKGLLIAACIKP